MKLGDLVGRYELFVAVGIIMVVGTLIKILGFYDFSSDWFLVIAGIALVIEGSISWQKQRKFDRKYKIIERSGKKFSK